MAPHLRISVLAPPHHQKKRGLLARLREAAGRRLSRCTPHQFRNSSNFPAYVKLPDPCFDILPPPPYFATAPLQRGECALEEASLIRMAIEQSIAYGHRSSWESNDPLPSVRSIVC